ncbi:MAG TPA: hypothetical protein PLT65_04335 [Bacilli bacterium]|nr:hypothetical protein [Bacilli bacterium]
MGFTLEQTRRIGYLQDLANKYGDFRVAFLKKKEDGEIIHSKWRSVIQCWETEEGLYFLSIANNREPLPIEAFIDIDIEILGKTREEVFNILCDLIEKSGEKYIGYKSGSKGYHIHFYNKSWATLSKHQRELIREKLFLQYFNIEADKLKYSDHAMLAIENIPHWKTGNKKERIRGNWEL